jgi:hypothetical protein
MNSNLKNIAKNKSLQTPEQVTEFEKSLAELSKKMHPELLEDIFLLFNDEAKYDESLWGLLHYVESHNQEFQVEAFFKSFLKLSKNGEEWIKTILFRMMNNENLLRLLILKSPLIKQSDMGKYKKILLEIGVDPKFKSKVNEILDEIDK